MRKFSFTLEKVLSVRRAAEQRHKQEYFEHKRRRAEEQLRLELLTTEVARSTAAMRARATATFDMSLERAYFDYLQCLQGRIETCRERIQVLEQELERRLQALLHVRKAVRALERLRERRYEAYRQDQRRREQRRFDEMAVLRHGSSAEA